MKKGTKRFNLSKNLNKIYNNRKLSNEQKVSLMINDFCFYYNNQLNNEVTMCTYELYYERFMIDEKHKHNVVYKKYFDYEYQNYLYLYFVELNQYFAKLSKNIDPNKINLQDKEIYVDILKLSERCHFGENFDYTKFYYNEAIREMIVKNMQVIEKHFIDYSKSLNDLLNFN